MDVEEEEEEADAVAVAEDVEACWRLCVWYRYPHFQGAISPSCRLFVQWLAMS